MKLAVIIKHPYRDYDFRVDIVDAPEDTKWNAAMKQKFRVLHLSSFTPLIKRILEHAAAFTDDNENFPTTGIKEIVKQWQAAVPHSVFHYKLSVKDNLYTLREDGKLVLSMELVDVYELEEVKQ